MSKIVKGVTGVGSAVLGTAAPFLPPGLNVLAAAGSVGLGVVSNSIKTGGGSSYQQQLQTLQQIAELLKRPPPLSQTVNVGEQSPRILAFGRVRQSGISFLKENTPAKQDLFEGLYLNEGPFDGVDAFICDDELVPLTPSGPDPTIFIPTTGSKYTPSGRGGYNTLLLVEFVNGVASGYWSHIGGTVLPSAPFDAAWAPFWDNTHLGKGISCVYVDARAPASAADRLTVYPNGFPQYSIIYRGARVYDPRDGSQTFDENNFDIYNTSWKWSENPALCLAHYVNWLRSQNLTAILGVNWDAVAEMANDCDRLVPVRKTGFNGGGISYEPFARCSALVTLDMEPRDVIAKFLECCDGDYGIDQNGLFTPWVRKWEEPQVVFGNILGDFTEELGPSSNDEVNYVHSTFIDPRQGNKRVEAPIYIDANSEAAVGRRTGGFVYDWVTSSNQAYRLTARKIKRVNQRRRITCSLGVQAMTALQQRVVRLNATEFDLAGVFRVEALTPTDDTLANWQAELVEVFENDFDDEVQPEDPTDGFKIVNRPTLTTPSTPIAAGVSTGSGVGVAQLSLDLNQNDPTDAQPSITAADLLTDPTVQMDGRWSTDGGSTWSAFDVQLSQLILQTPELPSGTTVTMQARFVTPDGTTGSYSSSVVQVIP
ncbi:MAG: hypothetical protein U1E25_07405 [Methylocystis sp.]